MIKFIIVFICVSAILLFIYTKVTLFLHEKILKYLTVSQAMAEEAKRLIHENELTDDMDMVVFLQNVVKINKMQKTIELTFEKSKKFTRLYNLIHCDFFDLIVIRILDVIKYFI